MTTTTNTSTTDASPLVWVLAYQTAAPSLPKWIGPFPAGEDELIAAAVERLQEHQRERGDDEPEVYAVEAPTLFIAAGFMFLRVVGDAGVDLEQLGDKIDKAVTRHDANPDGD